MYAPPRPHHTPHPPNPHPKQTNNTTGREDLLPAGRLASSPAGPRKLLCRLRPLCGGRPPLPDGLPTVRWFVCFVLFFVFFFFAGVGDGSEEGQPAMLNFHMYTPSHHIVTAVGAAAQAHGSGRTGTCWTGRAPLPPYTTTRYGPIKWRFIPSLTLFYVNPSPPPHNPTNPHRA